MTVTNNRTDNFMVQYGVILFPTTSAVMRAEKLLVKAGHKIKLIPTPREFSSDCGIALRFEWDRCEDIKSYLNTANIETESIHQIILNH
jgi:hypothetical protein